ncbi:hypothetical protein K1719_031802 [Acacia pycnantha]|nr:hypothetical protein K1719_031802 [Acacia pycnantha]
MEVTGQELVVWNKDHQAQQVMKGKRTKRSRLPSPLRLSMASSSSSAGGRASTDDHSGGSSSVVDMATTSIDPSRVSTEEEDMANCLILLAQGHNTRHEPSSRNNNDDNKTSSGLYVYQCKTCDRCFPSFQALGGHRASHKKQKPNNSEEKLQSVAFAKQEAHHDQPYDATGTSFVLSLQISNSSIHNKSKVHECSICGAEFTSGQALGGHMRRHRTLVNNSPTCTTSTGNNNSQLQKANKPATKNALELDLNLPAPEDDHRESKLPFQSKENVLVFSASSLVDCHY